MNAVLDKLARALPLDGLAWDAAEIPQAAVLVALSDEAGPRIWLGKRTQHLRHHPGEIAFPGGKREAADATPWATALREAAEEAGICADELRPLGELAPLVTRTGFEVHPCIAALSPGFEPVVDRREFDRLFAPPLARFAERGLFHLERIQVQGRERMVPHYTLDGENVWGVTAAVLAILANIAYDAALDLQRDWSVQP